MNWRRSVPSGASVAYRAGLVDSGITPHADIARRTGLIDAGVYRTDPGSANAWPSDIACHTRLIDSGIDYSNSGSANARYSTRGARLIHAAISGARNRR